MKHRPNILFIMADDLGQWALGCYGNQTIQTPNIDKIANEGMLFNNFFCTSPVCSPARASILTGTIPSSHGVHDWLRSGNVNYKKLNDENKESGYFKEEKEAIRYLHNQITYVDVLANAGYHCGLSGKWHLGDSINKQHGFSHWYTIARGGCHYFEPDIVEYNEIKLENQYVTDLITKDATNFIKDAKNIDQPFYLSIHYTAPHGPWGEKEHPKVFRSLYKDSDFSEVSDVPIHPWQCNTCNVGIGEKRRENLIGYYAAITAMDKGIGDIFNTLRDLDILEDTIIIITSDNGMNMGHHGIWGKGNGTFPQNMFDTSVKVPMIMYAKSMNGIDRKCDLMLSQYDILPTILDMADLSHAIPNGLPGRSFYKGFAGEADMDNKFVVVFDEYGPVRMIRTKEYKYVHRYPYGPHEFYDLLHDPNEEYNLIDHKDAHETIQSLRNQMQQWFCEYVSIEIDGTNEAVFGKGQINLAGKFTDGMDNYAQDIEMWHS